VGKLLLKSKKSYIAGLIDGDGAIMAFVEKHSGKRFGMRVRICLKITGQRKGLEIIYREIFGRKGNLVRIKGGMEWITKDQRLIRDILEEIGNDLIFKKKQAKKALEILEMKEKNSSLKNLSRCIELANLLSNLNIRSKKKSRSSRND